MRHIGATVNIAGTTKSSNPSHHFFQKMWPSLTLELLFLGFWNVSCHYHAWPNHVHDSCRLHHLMFVEKMYRKQMHYIMFFAFWPRSKKKLEKICWHWKHIMGDVWWVGYLTRSYKLCISTLTMKYYCSFLLAWPLAYKLNLQIVDSKIEPRSFRSPVPQEWNVVLLSKVVCIFT